MSAPESTVRAFPFVETLHAHEAHRIAVSMLQSKDTASDTVDGIPLANVISFMANADEKAHRIAASMLQSIASDEIPMANAVSMDTYLSNAESTDSIDSDLDLFRKQSLGCFFRCIGFRRTRRLTIRNINTKIESNSLVCTFMDPAEAVVQADGTPGTSFLKPQVPNCQLCKVDFVNNDKLRSLKCAHVFHQDCIDTYFGGHRKCPECKMLRKQKKAAKA